MGQFNTKAELRGMAKLKLMREVKQLKDEVSGLERFNVYLIRTHGLSWFEENQYKCDFTTWDENDGKARS